jgi:GNAT superfamily N-acetyltransferase
VPETYCIRSAVPREADLIADIELAGVPQFQELPGFETAFIGFVARPEKYRVLVERGLVFVAANDVDWPVGFCAVGGLDDEAYLAELGVMRAQQNKGLGSRLVERACEWAHENDYASILLSTFRNVPWNAPFYEKRGFRPLDPAELDRPGIKAQREHEAEFLDMSNRVFMRKILI